MKKFIQSALLPLFYFLYFFLCCSSPPMLTATASNVSYACITEDNTFFYLDAQCQNGLFILPKTYFVKVLNKQNDYCKVEYLIDDEYAQKCIGYAKTEQLSFVDFTPKTPYFYQLIQVKYTIDASENTSPPFLNEIAFTCAYYGDYTVGTKTYCYILRGGEFGYIPKPDSVQFIENPEYANWQQTQSGEVSPDTSTPSKVQSSPTQIIILIAVCLLVPLLASLILRPTKKAYMVDEED